MSYTPFNAPLLSSLLGDMELAAFFSVKAELDAMLRFEVELAQAEAEAGVLAQNAADAIAKAAETFEPDVRSLGHAVERDGMIVPEFVSQLRAHVGGPFAQHVHFASTSQDVIDTSLTLRLVKANEILFQRLDAVLGALDDLENRFGADPLLARTRMKVALPVTVADRIALWRAPLVQCREEYPRVANRTHRLQFGGPVGTLDKLGDQGPTVRKALAKRLGLSCPNEAWHTNRSGLLSYTHWLEQIAVALGKMGLDVGLMAQDEIAAIVCSGVGGSSAMTHKQNPIKAESLVTLSRFVMTQAAGMRNAAVHEQERSGASWTLEWMLLPQLVVASGASLRNAFALLSTVERMGDSSS